MSAGEADFAPRVGASVAAGVLAFEDLAGCAVHRLSDVFVERVSELFGCFCPAFFFGGLGAHEDVAFGGLVSGWGDGGVKVLDCLVDGCFEVRVRRLRFGRHFGFLWGGGGGC